MLLHELIKQYGATQGLEITFIGGVPHAVDRVGKAKRFYAYPMDIAALITLHKVHVGHVGGKVCAYVDPDRQAFADDLKTAVLSAILK